MHNFTWGQLFSERHQATFILPVPIQSKCFRMAIHPATPNPQMKMGSMINLESNTRFTNKGFCKERWTSNQTAISQLCSDLSNDENADLSGNERGSSSPDSPYFLARESLNYTCDKRSSSASYDLRSGYVRCHCDPLCMVFVDCCDDFVKSRLHDEGEDTNFFSTNLVFG